MYNKHSLRQLTALRGKRVLVRVDYNVPFKREAVANAPFTNERGSITDLTRIQETLPTLQLLLEQGAKVILASHLGRPKGQVVDEFSMDLVTDALQSLLPKVRVQKASAVVGETVEAEVAALYEGDILVLENVRFEAGEESNCPELSKALARLCDVYVNDAFGAAHRAHASTEGVAHQAHIAVAGLLMEREITALGGVLSNPKRPFTALIGGAKVSSKIAVLTNLLDKVDNLIIGGAMAYTFLLAQGYSVGKSLVEPDFVETAKGVMAKAEANGVKLYISQDLIVANEWNANSPHQTVPATAIPDGWEGMDIGPLTRGVLSDVLKASGSILWNGPVGVFEWDNFANGTRTLAEAVKEATANGTQSVLGGGDTLASIERFNMPKASFTHVSTGGGASLEFIEGKALPGIVALNDATVSV